MANYNPPTNGFKKGKSGNPDGRPIVDNTWAGWVRRIGEEQSPTEPKKIRKQKATEAVFGQAERGNYKAWSALADREEGSPEQALKHSGKIETTPNISSPALIAIAEEYEARILEELKKSNKDNQ